MDAASSSTSKLGGGESKPPPWGGLISGGGELIASLKDEVYHHPQGKDQMMEATAAAAAAASSSSSQEQQQESATPTEERQLTDATAVMSEDLFESSVMEVGGAYDDDEDDGNDDDEINGSGGGHTFYSASFQIEEEEVVGEVELTHQRRRKRQQKHQKEEERKQEEQGEDEKVEACSNDDNGGAMGESSYYDTEPMGESSYYSDVMGSSFQIGHSSQGDYDESMLTTSSSGNSSRRRGRRRKVPSLPTRKGQKHNPKARRRKEKHQSTATSQQQERQQQQKTNSMLDTSSGRFSLNKRRSFFAASKPFTTSDDEGRSSQEDHRGAQSQSQQQQITGTASGGGNGNGDGGGENDDGREQVDPTVAASSPDSKREYAFVISVGILLAFNMGFVNGACLSGFVTHTERRQGVAGYSNPYTESALYIAEGDFDKSKFQTLLIACFIGGSFISGAATPNAVPYRIEPTYGPSFLASALCLGVATLLAATSHDNDDFVFYLAGTASGIQNGISSSYTAKLIRSTGLTGSSTDIGLYLGQLARGNVENRPKLIVLLMLAVAFWCGGLISFYVTRHFTSLALLFSTTLFLIIGLSLMIFLVKKLNISFRAAILGTWQWKVAVEKIQCAFEEILDMSGHLNSMSDRELEEIFERIDIDNSGTIDSEELYILLRSTGVKITREESDAMLKFADKDKDGVLSMEEWKNAIHSAMKRKSGNVVVRKMKKVSESSRNMVAQGMASTRDLMAGNRSKSSYRGKSSGSVGSINDLGSDSDTRSQGSRHSEFISSQLHFSDELEEEESESAQPLEDTTHM